MKNAKIQTDFGYEEQDKISVSEFSLQKGSAIMLMNRQSNSRDMTLYKSFVVNARELDKYQYEYEQEQETLYLSCNEDVSFYKGIDKNNIWKRIPKQWQNLDESALLQTVSMNKNVAFPTFQKSIQGKECDSIKLETNLKTKKNGSRQNNRSISIEVVEQSSKAKRKATYLMKKINEEVQCEKQQNKREFWRNNGKDKPDNAVKEQSKFSNQSTDLFLKEFDQQKVFIKYKNQLMYDFEMKNWRILNKARNLKRQMYQYQKKQSKLQLSLHK